MAHHVTFYEIRILVVARVSDLYERLPKFSLYLMLQSNVWESKSDFPLVYSILQFDTIHVPSPTELYQQCAVTLLNAGRYQDTLTVCDKVLTTADSGKKAENGMK